MKREAISTSSAPDAIGTYSQAIKVGDMVYLSGQIPLDPVTGDLVSGDIRVQIQRVFENLAAVALASGTHLQNAVKITIYLTDLANFGAVNEIMATFFNQPYPARAAVGIGSLPKGAAIEADAILTV
jgi:reactive intermediate/imine deaminase